MALVAASDSEPNKALGMETGKFFASQTESYTDDDSSSCEESRIEETGITAEKSIADEQEREDIEEDAVPVENVTSPKRSLLSKLKPFSPRSLTSPRRKAKSNHFFSEPSPKNVLSPRSGTASALPLDDKKVEEKVSLAVAPGRLGLTLKIDKQRGGATILSIHPKCAFHGKVSIGDYIVAIDDRNVRRLEDFKVDSDKKRNFVVRRTKKLSEPSQANDNDNQAKENVVLEPEDPKSPDTAPQPNDSKFSLVEMNASHSSDGSSVSNDSNTTHHTTHTKEELALNDPEANNYRCARFNCAQGKVIVNEFVANRFSCGSTVTSDSSSSFQTFFKPITSMMKCGQANEVDFAVDINIDEMDEISDELPSIEKISKLQVADRAFIKRSNGEWTFSTVLDVTNDSITFSVDNFGNGKTITRHRWTSSIRLLKREDDDDDDEDDDGDEEAESTVAEQYSMSTSSSGSQDIQPLAKPVTSPTASVRKAQLKAMVEKKRIALKAKKLEKKKQAQEAKAAKAEAKRKERELKEAQDLELKLRLMHLEERKIVEEANMEKEKIRMIEEKKAKNIADLEEKKRRKLAKIEADHEEKKRKKLAKKQAALDLKREREEEKMAIALEIQAEKEAKIERKKLQKARKEAAALEAQRQAELVFQDLGLP